MMVVELATELSEATARLRAAGALSDRLVTALAALTVARRAIAILEEDGDPARFAGYAMAAIEIIDAAHAIRRAPALGRSPEPGVRRDAPRPRSTSEQAEVRALVELADTLEEGFTDLADETDPVNDRLACLTVAGHAARWRDLLAPGGSDGDLR